MTKVSKKDMEVFTSFSKVNFMVGDLLLGTFKIVLLYFDNLSKLVKISLTYLIYIYFWEILGDFLSV